MTINVSDYLGRDEDGNRIVNFVRRNPGIALGRIINYFRAWGDKAFVAGEVQKALDENLIVAERVEYQKNRYTLKFYVNDASE